MINIERVEQKHELGCAVACLSMILKKDYDEIAKDFNINFDNYGMDSESEIRYIINNSSYGILTIDLSRLRKIKREGKNFCEPFADAHILSVQPFANQIDTMHAVVMDKDGNIYDPYKERDGIRKLDEYYDVWTILGIFE